MTSFGRAFDFNRMHAHVEIDFQGFYCKAVSNEQEIKLVIRQ